MADRFNAATMAWLVTVATALCLILSGCGGGGGGGGGPTPPPTSSPKARPTTSPTTTPTVPQNTNIWQYRGDISIGKQITYDLSGDVEQHGFYGACWAGGDDVKDQGKPQNLAAGLAPPDLFQHIPADKQFIEGTTTYGEYNSDVGVTLLNLRNDTSHPGCLLRKSRLPIDLSTINRIEMDIRTSGGTAPNAPWFAVWLTPMLYNQKQSSTWAAEIDIVENFGQGIDTNNARTNFGGCGESWDPILPDTASYCQISSWDGAASDINHHVTVSVEDAPNDGGVVHVRRCRNPQGQTLDTCTSGPDAWMKVHNPAPPGVDGWQPIWNKEVAGRHFAHYWLVADIWFTSGTSFKLSVDNVKFFKKDGTEWKMPLDGAPPQLLTRRTLNGTSNLNIVV